MKVKISTSFSGVIATGSYENTRPSYAVEFEAEIDDMLPEQFQDYVRKNQEILQKICYNNFKLDEQRQIVERITKERSDMRFYDGYPSVTSILNWDADFFLPPQDLQQYASQGALNHAQVAEFIRTGEWKPVKDIEGTWADIVIVSQGSLKLGLNGCNFPAFLKKYPLEKMENGKQIKSDKHKFGGTPDIRICYYEGKKTLADVKRTPDKIKNMKQISAYILAEEENGESPYDQMMIIPLNDKTDQGFSKPILVEGRDKIKQYQEMFLRDRENFKKRFGI